ncbi:MAG: helix-turn-helix domain-containing protein [Streptosporangiaceae bacterium]
MSTAARRDIERVATAVLLLTVEEAAQRLSIGRTTMYSLVSTGAIKSVTIGRLRRIPSDCLEEYVLSLRASGQPGSAAALARR